MHKLNTDEVEAVEISSPQEATETDPQNVPKKKRRRSRRRGRGGGAAAKGAAEPTNLRQEGKNEAVSAAPAKSHSHSEPSPPKGKSRGRRRRGENGAGKQANGAKRQDLGSWRAEPHSERMRRRPGQAQAHSPSLWAAWSAAHFGKGGSSESD